MEKKEVVFHAGWEVISDLLPGRGLIIIITVRRNGWKERNAYELPHVSHYVRRFLSLRLED